MFLDYLSVSQDYAHIYKETREKADKLLQSVDVKTVNLVNEFGIEEKWPQYCGQQIICNIVSSERVKKY